MDREKRLEATTEATNNLEMKCITKRKHVRPGRGHRGDSSSHLCQRAKNGAFSSPAQAGEWRFVVVFPGLVFSINVFLSNIDLADSGRGCVLNANRREIAC